jgi:hypothetical protein
MNYNLFKFIINIKFNMGEPIVSHVPILQCFEHISEKICSVELIIPVRLSVCSLFFRHSEDYLRTHITAWIYDPLPRSSGIDLGVGLSHFT